MAGPVRTGIQSLAEEVVYLKKIDPQKRESLALWPLVTGMFYLVMLFH